MILHQNILCFVNFDDRNGAKSEFYYRFGGSGHIFNCFVLFAFTLQHTFHVGIYLRWYQINVVRTHAHTHKKKTRISGPNEEIQLWQVIMTHYVVPSASVRSTHSKCWKKKTFTKNSKFAIFCSKRRNASMTNINTNVVSNAFDVFRVLKNIFYVKMQIMQFLLGMKKHIYDKH